MAENACPSADEGAPPMSLESLSIHSPLVAKLETLMQLTDEERRAVTELPMIVRDLREDHDIVREGDRPTQACLLIEGFAHRYQAMGDGRRQIMSFHIPGDIPDLLSIHLSVMDHNLGTLAPSKCGFISHQNLRGLIAAHPRIGDAFWRDTLIDGAIFRTWLTGIGRRNAYARIAHLLCELVTRMRAVGLQNGNSVRLPLTQEEIGDALGLSTVHVNRVVQQLRADGLITWHAKALTVNDWEGLKRAGEFDPTYLHLRNHARAAMA
jgi:CRP-like cAMP-binding protein